MVRLTIEQLFLEISKRGIKLKVDGDRLRSRAPKGAITPALRQEMRSRKAELLAFLRQAHSPKMAPMKPRPASLSERIPLSFAQQRLWFLEQLEGPSATYNISAALHLAGPLDETALQQSLTEIVRRHEALRTIFTTIENQAFQVIQAPALTLPVVDLSQLPTSEKEGEVRQRVTLEAQQPFDLANGPLLRVTRLRLDDEQHVLLLTMHHIVSDGWSIGLFIREFSTLYSARQSSNDFSRSGPGTTEVVTTLPPLPIQYADFAYWQREWLTGEVLESQVRYWKEQLAGAPSLLNLPTDRPRPAIQSFRGTSYEFVLPTELSEALKRLSQASGATLFMTLQAAFSILLARYSAQEDILIGTPIANRNRVEIEPLIGLFVNTLVLRTDLSDNPSVEQLLKQVRATTLAAYQQQDLPFELLVNALQPERNLSHTPLFQVMFALQNAPQQKIDLPDLTLTPLEIETSSAKFDLTLTIQEQLGRLVASWEYNTDLFDRATIQRMAGHFQTLLEGIVKNPQQRVSELEILTEAERHQLLVEWNNNEVEYANPSTGSGHCEQCIHELFEQQVIKTPDAVALIYQDQQLTYRELNARANQLAHHLIGLGVGPNMLVGLCVERSINMVVGLLGILKAGGAYLPLEPSYPSERLAFMLSDANVHLLLTENKLSDRYPDYRGVLLCLDQDWDLMQKEEANDTNPQTIVQPNHLAYCIYTSGSTGQPKGVLVEHASLVTHCLDISSQYGVTSQDKVLQLTSIGFDPLLEQLFTALLNGGQLTIGSFAPDLLAFLRQKQITIADLTPVVFVQLIEALQNDPQLILPALRVMIVGGEVFPATALRLWRQSRLNQIHLINAYGPTETTITATTFTVPKEFSGNNVPIGRPTGSKSCYLLDEQLQPVPIGVPGELHIGGAGLARGYLNRPELTREKFINNPFGPGRLYKTGDLCRYLPDGSIEYLGRLDHQVKIRGFRIELGEIEAVLSQHESVREVVVMAREEGTRKRLVAYLVPHKEIVVDDIRAFLRQTLPDYMVPAAFVQLDAMPLTPNGKVNRRLLPKPEIKSSPDRFVAPQTPIQEQLAAIWADVLGLKQASGEERGISIHDNFFELGGDSILSLQIISRAKSAGLHLTPKQLFEQQTIQELARVAEPTGESGRIQAQQGLVTGTLPLTPIQHGFFEQKRSDPHHFNQSVLLEVVHNIDPTLLLEVVAHLLEHHDALRLRFVQEESGWRQVLSVPSSRESVPFSVIDLSEHSPEEQTAIMRAQANQLQASLNLSEGPLMRVALFQLGTNVRLLMIIHHLAVDGVSWRILLEDLERAYQQLKRGEAIQLPAKSTSFKEWAHKLTQQGRQIVADDVTYWRSIEHSLLTASELGFEFAEAVPLDDPLDQLDNTSADSDAGLVLAHNTVASEAKISCTLPAEQTHALLQEVPAVYHTQINDLLLLALVQTFEAWSGEPGLLIELEGHGREDIFASHAEEASPESVDLSRTVGWFTTLFPVLLELDVEEGDLGAAIQSIKEQLRRIPRRGIGYGILRHLAEDPALKKMPPAEVLFNYLGQFGNALTQKQANPVILGPAKEDKGAAYSPNGTRTHLLEINAIIIEDELQIEWTYSQNLHHQETIDTLAANFIETLSALIAHCQQPEAGGYTASDFPLAQLDEDALNKLASMTE